MVSLAITDYLTASCAYRHCDMPVTVLRDRYCDMHKGAGTNNVRDTKREKHVVEFTGIDGEGTGHGKDHRYVLLGVGDRYRTWPHGPDGIDDVFSFLWECYLANPRTVYAGFFLSYDFNMWLKMLPRERAAMLLTDAGRAKRQRKNGNPVPFPVRYRQWEFDMLGYRRFKLRPIGEQRWLWINDTGPFFQQSLLKVIDPAKWPVPVVTDEEYRVLSEGKARRSDAVLDSDMIAYNALENMVLARVLTRLNEGFVRQGVRLNRQQWFGPGQAAQTWMHTLPAAGHAVAAVREYPLGLHDALRASYYGGRFEIAAHGIVPGISHEYDINSAYPHAIAALPCSCGAWVYRQGKPPGNGLALCHIRTEGSNRYLGGLPYRDRCGNILYPQVTTGWYWAHEIAAAKRAKLISNVSYRECWVYRPCTHNPPLAGIAELYDHRLRVGKDTPEGKACKLLYNSVYGKFAQSVGSPRFGNSLYASLITSYCRTQILDAIATHPDGARAVLMIATDGIYFATPHSKLPISNKLGEWSYDQHCGLTLFKPGVYWDDRARERIRQGKSVAFKARGISASDFATAIRDVDIEFESWDGGSNYISNWPSVTFRSRFAQVSVSQALQWTVCRPQLFRGIAGMVREDITLRQSSDPRVKRDTAGMACAEGIWRSRPHRDPGGESAPYDRRFGFDPDLRDISELVTPDVPVMTGIRDALGVG